MLKSANSLYGVVPRLSRRLLKRVRVTSLELIYRIYRSPYLEALVLYERFSKELEFHKGRQTKKKD
jgi:hypothetical protein